MKSILFVDDQPNVLAGLRRMLFRLRDEWQMEFVDSGETALARLQQQPFDVVVSDMRMPGMDGAQLLTEVRRLRPETIRLILSGQSNQEATLRAIGPTHQYLTKPCSADVLQQTIAQACQLRDRLLNPSLLRLVCDVGRLPSVPAIYYELLHELENPRATSASIAAVITRDVAMTAKILQLVNSSFFALKQRVVSPAQAITLLGLDLLRPLVLSAGVFSEFSRLPANELTQIVEHSVRVGHEARRLACAWSIDRQVHEDAFTAGLLHDVGKLLLLDALRDRWRELLDEARRSGRSEWELEAEQLGADHAALGAYLLSLWGLPNSVVQAVAFHHQPAACQNRLQGPLAAVHTANALDLARHGQVDSLVDLDLHYLKACQLESERLPLEARLDQPVGVQR